VSVQRTPRLHRCGAYAAATARPVHAPVCGVACRVRWTQSTGLFVQ
jgi:hypothetical protein